MPVRSALIPLILMLSACGSDSGEPLPEQIPEPEPGELKYTLTAPPALRGLLWATDQFWPRPGTDVDATEYDLFLLDDGAPVIETINRVSEESWRVSYRPQLTSDRRAVFFTVKWGDESGTYAYDPATGQRTLVVPGLTEPFVIRDDRVIAWRERLRPATGGPFRQRLFVGSVDGTIPPTEIDADEDYDIEWNSFDLSPDGERIVWTADYGDSIRLTSAPTDNPTDKTVLAEFADGDYAGAPQFVDDDRIVYEHLDRIMVTRLTDPTSHVRVDAEPATGLVSRPPTVVVSHAGGAHLVYPETSGSMTDPDFRRHLMVVSLDAPGVAWRINPDDVVVESGYQTSSFRTGGWDISDNGRWLAWLSLDDDDRHSLWLSDLSDPTADPQRVADFTSQDAFRFLPDSSALLHTDAGRVYRIEPGHPFTSTPLADVPDQGRVAWIRGLPDGVNYLMNIHPGGGYGRRLWVGSLDGHEARILITGSPTLSWQEFDFLQLP